MSLFICYAESLFYDVINLFEMQPLPIRFLIKKRTVSSQASTVVTPTGSVDINTGSDAIIFDIHNLV